MRGLLLKLVSRSLWMVIPLAVLLDGIIFTPSATAQLSDIPRLTVIAPALGVRRGPGDHYAIFEILINGDEVTIIGRNTPNAQWQVRLLDERSGWVSGNAAYILINGDTTNVPEVVDTERKNGEEAKTPLTLSSNKGTIVVQTFSGGLIYAVNPDGSNLRLLTTGIDPSLSPNGRQVAFTRWEGSQHGAPGSLWVINVDGTDERVILNDVRQPKAPVWSPDGTKIAISMQQGGRLTPEHKCTKDLPDQPLMADEGGDYFRVAIEVEDDGEIDFKICYTLLPHPFWGLRMVDIATGEFQDLPRDLFSYAPTWDPANDWHLVYDGERGLVNLDLNRGTTWALTEDVRDHSPIFSPDGRRIAVSYKQQDHWDIHVLNADGSGRVRLTKTPMLAIGYQIINGEDTRSWNNAAPAWSPDGSQIIFLTDRTGRWQVWVMNADGSNQRPMFSEAVNSQLQINYASVDERVLSWR